MAEFEACLLQGVNFPPCPKEISPMGGKGMKKPWERARLAFFVSILFVPALGEGNARAQERKADFLGDPLPPRAILRLGTTRLRHDDSLDRVAFSPDGKILAGRSYEGKIIFWEMPAGKFIRSLDVSKDERGFAFSPDGRFLASSSYSQETRMGQFRVWEVATGRVIFKVPSAPGFTFQGWSWAPCQPFVFAPDSRSLATIRGDHLVQFWDFTKGKEQKRLQGPGKDWALLGMGFSAPKKLILLCQKKNRISGWDASAAKELFSFPVPDEWMGFVTFSPDGKRFALGGVDKIVSLRDSATGKAERYLKGHGKQIYSMAFSTDGKRLVSGSWDATLRIWDLQEGKQIRVLETVAGGLSFGVFSPDGKILATGGGNGPHWICLWDLATGKELPAFRGHISAVTSLAFSPDGKQLASAARLRGDSIVRLWDPATGKLNREIDTESGHGGVSSIAFSPDGRQLSTNSFFGDGTVVFWDPESGVKRDQIAQAGAAIGCALFSPDGKRLIVTGGAANNTVAVRAFDLQTKKRIWEHPGPEMTIWDLAISPDGNITARGGSSGLELWSTTTGGPIIWKPPLIEGVWRLAFSPDSRHLATALADGTLFWELATQKVIYRLPKGIAVAVSPHGRFFALASDKIDIYDLATGKICLSLAGGRARVLAFSPDGRRLASGMYDTTVLIWDVAELPALKLPGPIEQLTEPTFQRWWSDLLSADAAPAYGASWKFIVAGAKALPFLRAKLTAKQTINKDVARFIEELGDKRFAVRQAAEKKLAALGRAAEEPLRQALEKAPPLEVRRRLETLIAALAKLGPPEQLRTVRALAVLEHMPGPESLGLLETLAHDPPESGTARAAQKILQRRKKGP
jgi:WD40 repeat protein